MPKKVLLRAELADVLALSIAVYSGIAEMLTTQNLRRLFHWNAVSAYWKSCEVPPFGLSLVRVSDCRDPKGNKYLELALAAGAEIIVSSDDDLIALHPWRGTCILRPADYLARQFGLSTPWR